jgi:hypothetical protein
VVTSDPYCSQLEIYIHLLPRCGEPLPARVAEPRITALTGTQKMQARHDKRADDIKRQMRIKTRSQTAARAASRTVAFAHEQRQ